MCLELPLDIEAKSIMAFELIENEAISIYQFLMERFCSFEPRDDELFQFVYKSFYGFGNAGITKNFKSRYFELMTVAKREKFVDLRTIVTELYEIPNQKGQKSLQFSFATKLAATLNPNLPLYDIWVAKVFGFRVPEHNKDFGTRLSEYISFYEKLTVLYDKTVESDKLKITIDKFRDKFDVSPEEVSSHKVLDFVFWAVGKQAGKLRK